MIRLNLILYLRVSNKDIQRHRKTGKRGIKDSLMSSWLKDAGDCAILLLVWCQIYLS